ncbi:elongation factor G [bacterium]|nr:elongation factor G [bacterium]MBU1064145.1 elongation factor G [bacterium]MBU1635669.1 elongation factor G [bacterium]MBU1873817.1 elongation factor G [bacterium]
MKEFQTNEIRNIAVFGHASSGKTSLVEALLYTAGLTNRLGRIDEGTTVSDYNEDEIVRKFSISSSLLHCEWKKSKVNIIDAPGYLDFISESKAITPISDLGLIVVHAQSGVELGTELVFNYTKQDELPIYFVINMLDKEHANFDKTLEAMRESFGKQVVPVQIPVNQGVDFDTIIDILSNKQYTFSKDGKGTAKEEAVPADMQEKVNSLREQITEYVAESDDALLEKFFEEGALSDEELMTGLKKAIITRNLFPVFTMSAFQNVGASTLLDSVIKYGPEPDFRGKVKGEYKGQAVERKIIDDEPTSLMVFKTTSEKHVGELSFFRVMSGTVRSGIDLINSKSGNNERINQIFVASGKEKLEVAHLHAGDIGAVVKLKKTHTNDTLCDSKSPIIFADIKLPEPVLQVAIEPKSRDDEEKINAGLQTLTDEDPTATYHYDPELKQTILSGQGELHLTILLERLKQKFNVEVEQLPPRIPYRETIRKKAESKFRHKKQSGGAGQFAEVWMAVEPTERGAGVEFTNSLVGQNVDRVFVPSVEKGVKAACDEGILAGYNVTDVKANFYDGKMHPVDSKDIAFQIAGKGAFKDAFLEADPILLEPIYDLSVIIPEEFMGDIMGDVSVRRGKIQGVETEGSFQCINAKVPLAELYRYSTSLRSMTQGKGMHKQSFSHYEPMPREVQEKVVAEHKRKREEEH